MVCPNVAGAWVSESPAESAEDGRTRAEVMLAKLPSASDPDLLDALTHAGLAIALAEGAVRADERDVALDLVSGALIKLQAAVDEARAHYEASAT